MPLSAAIELDRQGFGNLLPMSEGKEFTFEVPEAFDRIRADKVVHHQYPDFTRSQIQRLFEAGLVWLDDEAILKNHKVRKGNSVTFIIPEKRLSDIEPVSIPLDVIYEDEYLIAVNKVPGMVVHPGIGTGRDTLVHALLHHCQNSLSILGGAERPGIVHRLDKETSGVIVAAKSDDAFLGLSRMFAERTMKKAYMALVSGVPNLLSGSIQKPLGRHPVKGQKMAVVENGRTAHTDWERVEAYGRYFALLRLRLHTGRTHQIRVHLADFGHPVLGDHLYGYRPKSIESKPAPRVMLHSSRLEFIHPVTGGLLVLEVALPEDFSTLLNEFRQKFPG